MVPKWFPEPFDMSFFKRDFENNALREAAAWLYINEIHRVTVTTSILLRR